MSMPLGLSLTTLTITVDCRQKSGRFDDGNVEAWLLKEYDPLLILI